MAKACIKYLPAKLDRRVVLQSVIQTPDGQGGFTEVWSDITLLWASINPLKGWERMQAQQIKSPITHKVIIRARDDITTANRLKYGDRLLSIKEIIDPAEAHTFLTLQCVETP